MAVASWILPLVLALSLVIMETFAFVVPIYVQRSMARSASTPASRMSATVNVSDPRIKEMPQNRDRPSTYTGACFVVKDNIDTDQIIPAEYLTLVPSKADEYEKLGSYALIGLPDIYQTRFVNDGSMKTSFPIVIAGDNFGCGSSREKSRGEFNVAELSWAFAVFGRQHAPIAMGAAGARVVVAESYARIFFRNSIATGELYPYECQERLVDVFTTGDEVTVNLENDSLTNHSTGKEYKLNPLGDAGPVIKAGGLFPYAIQTGMIKKQGD